MSMSSSKAASSGETPLRRELRQFRELSGRLLDSIWNRMFDLRRESAVHRMICLSILFILSGVCISLRYYPLTLWISYIQDIFLYLLNPTYAQSYVGNPFLNLAVFVLRVLFDPRILRYLPIFLAPFLIAWHCAALYLTDIFELSEIRIAQTFVWDVALSGAGQKIRISQGEILEEHRTSPVYLIGGPGRVIVDLDSAAIFERADGTPHVIGPTGKETGKAAQLDGFERLRESIDLRDHMIKLRDPSGKASEIKSRSLDGIPVSATDVQFVFSVLRDRQKTNGKNIPYTFDQDALLRLVYKAASQVTSGQENPSHYSFAWINNMANLIRGKLGSFMNNRNLVTFLATYGKPEYEKAKLEEEVINKYIRELALSPEEELPKEKTLKPFTDFVPRYKIADLFSEFSEEFKKDARDRGVELHWIGVGTWKTIDIVSEKHIEAWKLSRENLGKGSPEAMEAFENEIIVQELSALIQDVPLAAYQKAMEEYQKHDHRMWALLLAFRKQLIEARDFKTSKGESVPSEIEEAITAITGLYPSHGVGNPPPKDE